MLPMRPLAGLLIALLAAPAVEAEIKPLDKWRALQTPNFRVLGDVGESDLRRVAARLEQFREAVGRILPRATVTSATPTVVIVFRSHRNYLPFKPLYQGKPMEHIAGYFLPGQGVNFVTLTTESRGADPDEALRIVYHELVHLMVRNSAPGIPPWLNEGLAEYYRMLDITDGGRRMTVGRVHEEHVFRLREEFIPIEQLIAVDRASPLYNESSKASVFYAQSWALVHYLLVNDMVNNTTRATALLQAISGGASFGEACQQALGVPPAGLEKALRDYVKRDRFTSMTLRLTERIDTLEKLPVAPAAPADVHATLGALLVQMDRRDDARAQLEVALAAAPSHAHALSAMGSLLMREGRRDDARPLFERAAASPDATALVHYQHAASLHEAFGLGAGRPEDVDRSIEAAYRRAIALDASIADAYVGLARLLADRGRDGREPLDLMMKAIQLAPGRSDYRLNFGIMLSNREAFADARTVLAPLSASADDEQIRTRAASLLKQIADYEVRRQEFERRRAAAGAAAPSAEGDVGRLGAPVAVPDLRPPQAGEDRVFGMLKAIECPRGAVRLVVKEGDREVRVRARAFDGVDFISYRNDLKGSIACGARATDDPVLVTYRPSAADGTLGEVVAVEFVPLSYRHQ